jgi:hypothetical protein
MPIQTKSRQAANLTAFLFSTLKEQGLNHGKYNNSNWHYCQTHRRKTDVRTCKELVDKIFNWLFNYWIFLHAIAH